MFRLIRWSISLIILGICLWFSVMVPLGKRTLAQHVRAIFSTPEAQDLVEGTKQEMEKVGERLRKKSAENDAAKSAAKPDEPSTSTAKQEERKPQEAPQGTVKPQEKIEPNERVQLDKLVREKTGLAKGRAAKHNTPK
jgi:hypothetical protein